MASGEVFGFGTFVLEVEARRLLHDGEPVRLATREFDLLHLLVSRAGQILSKDLLIEAAWRDVAVTDNSLEQAISSLRRTLTRAAGQQYIETEARRGYRFAAAVTRLSPRTTDEALDALLAPHRAWIEGRAALETLERGQIVRARGVFENVLHQVPEQASAHVGLANACSMQFEMTRADEDPDGDSLALALDHAREACRLDANYGEAWATLGFVLAQTGQHAEALAASRRAVALEPDNWRQHLRLASVSWGEERLREARRTLALLPGFPLAHWLAATVHVARRAIPEAERDLEASVGGQGQVVGEPSRFTGVAVHWLRGLIHMSQGDDRRAQQEFDRELAGEASGQLYARECCANTWYALGALRLRQARGADAARAFRSAIERVPRHVMARAGLRAAGHSSGGEGPSASGADASGDAVLPFEAVFAEAFRLILAGAGDDAARHVDRALAERTPGNAGWILPVEPLLNVNANPDVWAGALARLRMRAA